MKEFLELMKESEAQEFAEVGQRAVKIANFDEKLTSFVNLIGNKAGHSSHKRRFLMKEAETTSDFPVLFGTVLERQLRMKYKLVQPDWRKYIKVGTQNDFRNAWDMATYGNRAPLGVVKERGEYKADKLADGKFVIAVQKYGKRFGLSWETIINDDLGAFSDLAADLSLSAQNTEAKYATGLMLNAASAASAPNATLFSVSGTHPIDGNTFANLGSLPLTNTNLAATITLLKSQKDYDGNPILFNRFILVVPVAKEFAALQILSQNLLIATTLSSTSDTNAVKGTTSENIIAKYPITLAVNPWLDILNTTHGTTGWYLFGEPVDGDAIRINFLRGHESPEVCQKMSDKISLGGAPISPLEGDFDSDSINWRVRHVFGGVQTDPRYAYAQDSAT